MSNNIYDELAKAQITIEMIENITSAYEIGNTNTEIAMKMIREDLNKYKEWSVKK